MRLWCLGVLAGLAFGLGPGDSVAQEMSTGFRQLELNYDTPVDPSLQRAVEAIDRRLRDRHGIGDNLTAVGVLDLRRPRLALVRPDAIDYAASVPKVGILLAWFAEHPEAAEQPEAAMRHELGLMIKSSNNEMAAKYSELVGLRRVQEHLSAFGFYDATRGGGIWVGKHYGKSTERYLDPVGGHSHAATVRQLVRFYLLLEQDRLVSAHASRTMREIFASPEIPHLNDKFVAGLRGRPVQLRRKSGWWESWFHDSAVVTGPGRHYILVAMTHHPVGEAYLAEIAPMVDDLILATDVK